MLKRAKADRPFADERDFEEQKKGLIAPMKDLKIMADAGHVAWDMERFQFLDQHDEFDSIHPRCTVTREEVFGPVLAVTRFDEPEDAIRIANDTSYGLAAGLWTKDVTLAHPAARADPRRPRLDQRLGRL